MITLKRVNSSDTDFIQLVSELDLELKIRDGDEHAFYSQYNSIENINYAVVAYYEGIPAGCGAIKPYDSELMEVKRMYVKKQYRGKKMATAVLKELEKWTLELNKKGCVLETGIKQPEAIGLYTKAGYDQIPNFGQYKNIKNSVCFEKKLSS